MAKKTSKGLKKIKAAFAKQRLKSGGSSEDSMDLDNNSSLNNSSGNSSLSTATSDTSRSRARRGGWAQKTDTGRSKGVWSDDLIRQIYPRSGKSKEELAELRAGAAEFRGLKGEERKDYILRHRSTHERKIAEAREKHKEKINSLEGHERSEYLQNKRLRGDFRKLLHKARYRYFFSYFPNEASRFLQIMNIKRGIVARKLGIPKNEVTHSFPGLKFRVKTPKEYKKMSLYPGNRAIKGHNGEYYIEHYSPPNEFITLKLAGKGEGKVFSSKLFKRHEKRAHKVHKHKKK